ncbi:MAG: bifunctional glutamate N-acetyltransferase/amino-acid acetyltransferase ArgJ [Chloroflexi bacterium]|nr:bifunctional glutamate N-acetyltransferase/amino-acid acetyltransferase ArgJ [Chloroflexota bacterium]
MATDIAVVQGGVTTAKGFLAGATFAGIKTYGADKLDLGVLCSERLASAVATFTTNTIKSASVVLSQQHIARGVGRAIAANSGCANACVGEQGVKDAAEVASLAARKLGIQQEDVFVASTGVIGEELPMALIRAGLQRIQLTRDGGKDFARAILTTDTRTKEAAVSFPLGGTVVHLGGCAKGAAMIHPNMATMLSFITTDASVSPDMLRPWLKEAVAATFNMISVDGDTSCSDSVYLLANGAAGAPEVRPDTPEAQLFRQALLHVCTSLAKAIPLDGEGATKFIEVTVERAKTLEDARVLARAVASSVLVKAAVFGSDPNWGRILIAMGKTQREIQESRVAIYINDLCIVDKGLPVPFSRPVVVGLLKSPEVRFRIDLGLGDHSATAWGCDLTDNYVTLNAAYTT